MLIKVNFLWVFGSKLIYIGGIIHIVIYFYIFTALYFLEIEPLAFTSHPHFI